ncbi:MAG: type IV pilus assembly protein PilM [Deltaproteobacteria bacterium]|nr:type IV pilus assembly protein PilM [Deltaproteobacteria bacterium]
MTETIGLDIGSHSIKLVGMEKTAKGPFLTCLGLKRIPQSIDKEDINSLSILLKDLIEETDIRTKKVRLTVSGSGIHIRRMTLPSIPKKELIQTLPWEMKDNLPFPVETARIQYNILGEFVEDGAKKLDLLVVACPINLIDRTLSIANVAGLQVTHLDVSAFGLWNMLYARDQLKLGETVALIDLGSEKISLFLFKDETLQFSREMTPAGADLTRAITDGLPFEKDMGFLFEKAERIKEEVGILSGAQEGRVAGEKLDFSKISFLMRPVLERWVAEIGRSLDYYRNQFYGEKIDRILLTGGGAHLKNIASYLEGELHLPVELFNPLREMLYDAKRVNGQALDETGSMFTTAAGIALSEPRQVELLPVKEPFWSKIPAEKAIFILVPILTILIFLGMIWYKTGQVTALQKERADKVARVAKLEDLRTRLSVLKEKEAKIKQDLSLFPSLVTPPIPYRKALKEVLEVIPGNMTLTLFEIQSGGKPVGKPSQTPASKETEPQGHPKSILHLSGLAFGNDIHCLTALAKIIEGLERSPLFSHVKLISTDENKLYNQLATEFDIVCDIDIPNKGKD